MRSAADPYSEKLPEQPQVYTANVTLNPSPAHSAAALDCSGNVAPASVE